MRKPTPESMAKKAIHMINSDYKTFEEVCEALQRSEKTVRKYLKMHYAAGKRGATAYKKLCRIACENKRLSKARNKVPAIHIIETGYILSVGMEGVKNLLAKVKEVVLPTCCVGELAYSRLEVAQDFMKAGFPADKKVVAVFPKYLDLYEELTPSQKDIFTARMVEIVALAVNFEIMERRVVIHTNSARIEALAKMQCCNAISVDRV